MFFENISYNSHRNDSNLKLIMINICENKYHALVILCLAERVSASVVVRLVASKKVSAKHFL